MKHKNINWRKDTAGLSIKLSINMTGWLLTEAVGYKRLVLFVRGVGQEQEVGTASVVMTRRNMLSVEM